MLTYSLDKGQGPLYQQVYEAVKKDILSGKIAAEGKLPSKRTLAKHLGCSSITVENAYNQLIAEGYVYSKEKRGYYVSRVLPLMRPLSSPRTEGIGGQLDERKGGWLLQKEAEDLTDAGKQEENTQEIWFDFSSGRTETQHFPFSVMAKMIRETIAHRKADLLEVSPSEGVWDLRCAIADHLASFRGMLVAPEQIVIGAGTEYLYSLIVQLLGRDKTYCIENPGYKKLKKIYENNQVNCQLAGMDDKGIKLADLRELQADIAHINPAHHFPTGLSIPISRRYELLAWANESADRYIIEDDYDSEFRFTGKPLPTLESIDASEKVIYLNTFSKSLTSTIRISYMVLPKHLVYRFRKELGFYSCTVSTFEQYWLAQFIQEGYFEKHINRMRRYYGKKREVILGKIRECFKGDREQIIENQAGLHFILKLETNQSDEAIKRRLLKRGINIHSLSDYDMLSRQGESQCFLINYAGMKLEQLDKALEILKEVALGTLSNEK